MRREMGREWTCNCGQSASQTCGSAASQRPLCSFAEDEASTVISSYTEARGAREEAEVDRGQLTTASLLHACCLARDLLYSGHFYRSQSNALSDAMQYPHGAQAVLLFSPSWSAASPSLDVFSRPLSSLMVFTVALSMSGAYLVFKAQS